MRERERERKVYLGVIDFIMKAQSWVEISDQTSQSNYPFDIQAPTASIFFSFFLGS